MKFSFYLLVSALALLVAGVAHADVNNWERCGSTQNLTGSASPGGGPICYRINSSSATTSLRPSFSTNLAAIVCLEPSITDDAGEQCTADIRRCTTGTEPTTSDADDPGCQTVLDAVLNGTGGGSGTQRRCVNIGRGTWRAEMVAPASTDICILSVEAAD